MGINPPVRPARLRTGRPRVFPPKAEYFPQMRGTRDRLIGSDGVSSKFRIIPFTLIFCLSIVSSATGNERTNASSRADHEIITAFQSAAGQDLKTTVQDLIKTFSVASPSHIAALLVIHELLPIAQAAALFAEASPDQSAAPAETLA